MKNQFIHRTNGHLLLAGAWLERRWRTVDVGPNNRVSLCSTYGREVEVGEDSLLLCGEDAGCSWKCEDWLEVSELFVKVTDVLRRPDDRQERWLHLLGQESIPVCSLFTHKASYRSQHWGQWFAFANPHEAKTEDISISKWQKYWNVQNSLKGKATRLKWEALT